MARNGNGIAARNGNLIVARNGNPIESETGIWTVNVAGEGKEGEGSTLGSVIAAEAEVGVERGTGTTCTQGG